MANGKYINIHYPFRNSSKGFFVDLNEDDDSAVKSDLIHLILTQKGERYFKPKFGTNLLKYIFEPNDSITLADVNREIKETVKLYFPTLTVNEITVEPSDTNEYLATITISYTITDGVFEKTDIVTIKV
jgi:phage baseplate assembly protein W